ncbi:hypothetical protein J4404_00955 [Candidatus Woesearchaeota archaeon]|nr:hypothetical protein [Candidatus Woesearchaeota archaeon]
MENKQISLTLPKPLFEMSSEYSKEYGYRNLQEFILDLIRKNVVLKNLDRYKKIEEKMKKGMGVKKLNQKEAIGYLRSL